MFSVGEGREVIGFPLALNHVPSSGFGRLEGGLGYTPFSPLFRASADNAVSSSSISNMRSPPALEGFKAGETLVANFPSLLDFLRALFGTCFGEDPNVVSSE